MEIRPILSAMMRSKTGAALIAAQVALTLGILVNATYIVNDRLHVASRPSGVVGEQDVFMMRAYPFRKIADTKGMQLADEAALKRIPGVMSVAWTNQVPLAQSSSNTGFAVKPNQSPDSNVVATTYESPDSLIETFGLKLVAGRDFTSSDIVEDDPNKDSPFPQAVIITEPFARKLWGSAQAALGKPLYYSTGKDPKFSSVVGVVERLMTPAAQANPDNEGAGEYSVLYPIRDLVQGAQYVVRARPGEHAAVMAAADKALGERVDGRVLLKTHTIDELRADRYKPDRALAGMLVTVVVLLLLVTASGIVGMASLWVSQRRKQIGVRRALGARRVDILRYFLTENAMVTTGGVIAGIALALALNQLLVSTLELNRLPLPYLGFGMLALWALGLLAALGPAWRAARVPPAVATRSV